MSYKQIIEPAFKKGNLLLHVMECELDFKPLLSSTHESFQYWKKNNLSDFLAVMNSEEGARHTFKINGFGNDDICRDIYSSKAGYYGLPTTVIKEGVNVKTFDMSLNSVQNEIGLIFNAYSKNLNILYSSSNDIKSRVIMKEDGSVKINFKDTNLFSEYKHAQIEGVKDRKLSIVEDDESFTRFKLKLPDVNSLKQNKNVLSNLWDNVEEMGQKEYFKTIKDMTFHHWNEVLISGKLSDVSGIFTSSKYGIEIVRSVALAGVIMEKLSNSGEAVKPLPIVFYRNGIMEEIEINREMFKSQSIRSALGLCDGLTRKELSTCASYYLDALDKQPTLSK